MPLAFEHDGTHFWVGGVGDACAAPASSARCIRVYGEAEPPVERVGVVGPGLYVRITPTVSWSWNMEGAPAGETWYEPRRTVHRPAPQA